MLLNDEVFDFTDFTSGPMLYSARRGKEGEWKDEEWRKSERRKGRTERRRGTHDCMSL